MNIERGKDTGQSMGARGMIDFCLKRLEEAKKFNKGIDWGTDVVPHLSLEEMIGALVQADYEFETLVE